MNMKTGLFALGFLVATGAAMVSCSGDSDSGSNGSGASSSGGSSAGNTSSAGTTNNTAGTNNNTGGTNNNTGGTNNNTGGTNTQEGGEGPGFPEGGGGFGFPQGGAGFGIDTCPDAADGDACDQPGGFQNACTNEGGEVCVCQGQQQNREWNCFGGGQGEGGAGPGGNMADCGDTPEDGADCDGFGQCMNSENCICFQGETNCF
jgi:hypothetical protein